MTAREDQDDDFDDEPIEELTNQVPLSAKKDRSIYSGQKALKVLTNNDIVRYLQARLALAESNEIHWPPIMRLIFMKANIENINLSEMTIGTIEMLLNVPLQVSLTFGTTKTTTEQGTIEETCRVNLNDPDVFIPYKGGLFVEAISFIKVLFKEKFLTIDDIRPTARKLFSHKQTDTSQH